MNHEELVEAIGEEVLSIATKLMLFVPEMVGQFDVEFKGVTFVVSIEISERGTLQ